MEFISLEFETALDQAITASTTANKLLICGERKNQQMIEEGLEFDKQSPQEIIDAALAIDVEAWFKQKRQEQISLMEEEFDVDFSEVEGEWLGEAPQKQGVTLHRDILSGEPLQNLSGISLAVDETWKIPAYLKYGGWNDCPVPEEHCAIWKYWSEKYDARIIGVSGDIIEAYIARPPQTREQAMQLAWEQYLYCYDIVDQGVDTISNLGSSIINHAFWYFWWD